MTTARATKAQVDTLGTRTPIARSTKASVDVLSIQFSNPRVTLVEVEVLRINPASTAAARPIAVICTG